MKLGLRTGGKASLADLEPSTCIVVGPVEHIVGAALAVLAPNVPYTAFCKNNN